MDITDRFAGADPQTTRVVFNDGLGITATVDITLGSDVAGDLHYFSGDRLSLNATGTTLDRASYFDNGQSNETAVFTASLVSTTGDVDLASIEFQINSVRMRIGSTGVGIAADELTFVSNAGSSFDIVYATGELSVRQSLDSGFASLDTGNYVGTFSFTNSNTDNTSVAESYYHFRDDASADGDGLVVTAQFSVRPKPGPLPKATSQN